MRKWNRRELLKNSLLGLTALGTGAFALRETLAPTPAYGELGEFGKFLIAQGKKPDEAPSNARRPTASDSMGPYYKEGAPYRGYLMPKDAPGTPMVIRGRVYGHDTQKTLEGATIDVWQADDSGSYHTAWTRRRIISTERVCAPQGAACISSKPCIRDVTASASGRGRHTFIFTSAIPITSPW
ncbi:MAG: hypothetical protein OXG62_01570 [Nitrospinae bacterium]|nr:hypothetical protein [Nitrospinota bacterium]